ncbi:MAG: MarR family transcriptional regulator [Lachnospiraceae bacterium]|nr:MarR family transcriptional regulator [Lachnospiraceae bacterium]
MDTEHLKKLLDSCFLAKRIVETLPKLPEHMKPRHIHVLSVVHELQGSECPESGCRVSDVSTRLEITMPSVTKLVGELQQLGMLEKTGDVADGRVIRLRLTQEGTDCVERYVLRLHRAWAEEMKDITNEQAEDVIRILSQLRETTGSKKTWI